MNTSVSVTIRSTEQCRVTVTTWSTEHCREIINIRSTEPFIVTVNKMLLSRQYYQYVY